MNRSITEDTLAAAVAEVVDKLPDGVVEAQRITGISYRQLHRILSGHSTQVQRATMDRLERLGLDHDRLAVLAYAGNGNNAEGPPQTTEGDDASCRGGRGKTSGRATGSTS